MDILLLILVVLMSISFIVLLIFHLYFRHKHSSKGYIGIEYNKSDKDVSSIFENIQSLIPILQTEACREIKDKLDDAIEQFNKKVNTDFDCDMFIKTSNDEIDKFIEKEKMNDKSVPDDVLEDYRAKLKAAVKNIMKVACKDGKIDKERATELFKSMVSSLCD